MALIDEHQPLHVSIVGGEPLVRYRELTKILPQLAERGVHTQVVTSAVRQIPQEWIGLRRLQMVVSIDGLQPEHDERRTPATYDRILKHIEGHQITVHCTVTRQQVRRDGYIEEFLTYWQGNPNTRLMWVSLYTPQVGEISTERLSKADRAARRRRAAPPAADVLEAADARRHAQRLRQAAASRPTTACSPRRPSACRRISSGASRRASSAATPTAPNCGCIASAGLEAIGRHRLKGGIPVGKIFYASLAVGRTVARIRSTHVVYARRPASTARTSTVGSIARPAQCNFCLSAHRFGPSI